MTTFLAKKGKIPCVEYPNFAAEKQSMECNKGQTNLIEEIGLIAEC